ncbi:MAG: hypothetical protein AAB551_02310, partial [Patescibacteria group bacterium]
AIIVGCGVYFWQNKYEKHDDTNEPRFQIAEPVVAPVTEKNFPEQPASQQQSAQKPEKFTINTAKVGDIVKGLKVISVKPLLNSGREIKFEGQLTLTGKYSFSDFGGEYILSDLDAESTAKLPDEAFNWFYFSNQGLAEKEFGPQENSGTTTIVIDNFTMAMVPDSDAGGNFATLIKVLKK